MERLVDKEFAELILQIPDDRSDTKLIMRLLQDFVAKKAPLYGIVSFHITVKKPGKMPNAPMNCTEMEIYNSPYEGSCNVYQEELHTGNGGVAEMQVRYRKELMWSATQQEDIRFLLKIGFLVIGRSEAMNDLAKSLVTDGLTEIGNQVYLYEYYKKSLTQGKWNGQCANFINIKNMKLLNNRYKEVGGDILMRGFAKKLQDFVMEGECAVRLGGDNFFVVVRQGREDLFLQYLQGMKVGLAGKSGVVADVKMDSRVGYYYIQPDDTVQNIMDNSNLALRYSKTDAKGIVCFEDSMRTRMLSVKSLEDDITGALQREEFHVYYQPKAEITGKGVYKLCGAEALVRWIKGDTIIPPLDFIPLLEKNGRIAELDFYVLEHVCRDMRKWIDTGLKLVPISINFSRRHLKYSDIDMRIKTILDKYEIDSSLLEIEITESYDDEDIVAVSRFEKKMHKLNIRVSVDDFGSGFSSFRLIKNIATDIIKLDKSIVDGIGEATEDDIIIGHIIKMFNALGKEIIAEGVETKEQAEFLYENDCKFIQGYLYARPMPIEQYENFVRAQIKEKDIK